MMRLAMVGDVMLGRIVNEVLKERGPDYPWGDTLPLLRSADFRMCNLECTISDRGEAWSATRKSFHFRSDAKNIDVLRAANMNAVSLANNHALDYGYDALFDTLELLDKAAIRHAGAGRNLSEAERPAVIETGKGSVGIIAFTDNEPGWESTSQKPGVFYVPIEPRDGRAVHLLELIRRTKSVVDLLIVSAHLGPNWGYEPPPEHVPFAHAMVDAGADAVFGHSGHVFRGIEIFRRRPILYCLGDFIDDYAVDFVERNDQSCMIALEGSRKGIRSARVYPTKIQSCQAGLARGLERRAIAQKIEGLCAGFNTATRWNEARGYLEAKVPK
jgi:poly-gamma-glutamate capsule biosynthesis protein CapA/YwtB (metallophosphatase superfamily)